MPKLANKLADSVNQVFQAAAHYVRQLLKTSDCKY